MADYSRLPGPNADLWDWQLRGLCRGKDSSLFFHPEGNGAPHAPRASSPPRRSVSTARCRNSAASTRCGCANRTGCGAA